MPLADLNVRIKLVIRQIMSDEMYIRTWQRLRTLGQSGMMTKEEDEVWEKDYVGSDLNFTEMEIDALNLR